MDNVHEMTKCALEYWDQGYAPIPTNIAKQPMVKWQGYQEKPPTREQVIGWNGLFAKGGIGLITGSAYGLVVVDIDPRNGGNESFKSLHLPPTRIIRSGGGGAHYYYRWPKNIPAPSPKGLYPGVDIQGEKKYVIAPPSLHESGKTYEIVNPEEDLAEAPDWIHALVEEKPKLWKTGRDGVSEGLRNDTAASLLGSLFTQHSSQKWESHVWPKVLEWNCKNVPPMSEKELRTVYESVMQYHLADSSKEERGRQTRATDIYEHLNSVIREAFVDDVGTPYVLLPVGQHSEILPIQSSKFKNWALHQYWESTGRAPGKDTLSAAISLFEANIHHSGARRSLATRVAASDGAFWYDLTNQDWAAIKVTPMGWEFASDVPPLFYRFKHQQPQVKPIGGGNLGSLLEFVNIQEANHKLLFMVYLVACFVPDIPHPIPNIHGPQGSAKTTLFRMIKRIVDPSKMEVLSLPTNNTDLVQKLSHHWLAPFDNISDMPQWMSDTFCRAATGDGFSKRELYSNDEDVIYSFRRCVCLNGINVAGCRPDLLDRSILLGLERISPENRKDEQSVWGDFHEKMPHILGAVFDVLVKAMTLRPKMTATNLPRMADFALWGCAIAESLGSTSDAFLEAYRSNIAEQNEVAINEDPIASVVVEFMAGKTFWQGTMTSLLVELSNIAERDKINTSSARIWPNRANALSRFLNGAKVNLAQAGILVENHRGAQRVVQIRKYDASQKQGVPTASLESNLDDVDDVDDQLPF